MAAYLLKRFVLMIPTLLGIMVLNFVLIQAAPGGPVDQMLHRHQGMDATARLTGQGFAEGGGNPTQALRYDQELRDELTKQFGFDQPLSTRFFRMMGQFLTFDFGTSYFSDRPVWDLIVEKLPVSLSLGLWGTLIMYGFSIPLGIYKARHAHSTGDIISSMVLVAAYALPSFLVAVFLIVVFSGGQFFSWFPLRGLASEGAGDWPFWERALDYLWHMVLPMIALSLASFASLTLLTRNCFLDYLRKPFVLTARAKGASEGRILWRHVFRNAMLLVIAGFPATVIHMLFTGALLIEILFSLDGLGLLGYEAALNRDYPVVFATLFLFSLLGLLLNILNDLMYVLVDPRIDFETSTP